MITFTEKAHHKIIALLATQERDDLRLRLAVQPGGCSGLIHEMFFDMRELDGDEILDLEDFEVIIDKMSIPYLANSTIDYTDRIEQQGFTLNNPNTESTCACGASFA